MDIIRVRGKNKKRREQPQPGRRPGRPMKPFRELAKVKKPERQRFARIQTLHRRSGLTELENLPAELIEHIFFYAEELNLPQASPHLARKLSSEPVYRKTIIRAFGGRYGSSASSSDERKELQCAVLRTKWCRVNRIMNASLLIARSMLQDGWRDCPIYSGLELAPVELDPLLEHAQASLASTEKHYLVRCNMSPLRLICGCGPSDTKRELLVFRALTIPDYVIRRSADSTESLFMLRLLRHGWRLDHSKIEPPHLNPKPVLEAMAQAITSGNTKALLMLAELATVTYLRLDYQMTDSLHDFRHDFDAFEIPSELFRCATRQPQAVKLLQILLRLNIKSLPKDDPTVTSWAIAATKGEDDAEFARWLLELMEHGFGSQQESLFIYGRPKSWIMSNLPNSLRCAEYFDIDCGYDLSIFHFDDSRRYFWPI